MTHPEKTAVLFLLLLFAPEGKKEKAPRICLAVLWFCLPPFVLLPYFEKEKEGRKQSSEGDRMPGKENKNAEEERVEERGASFRGLMILWASQPS